MDTTLGSAMERITEVVLGPSLNVAVVLGLVASLITLGGLFRRLLDKDYNEIGRRTLVVLGTLAFPALAFWLASYFRSEYLDAAMYIFAMLYVLSAATCLAIINVVLWSRDYVWRDYTALTVLSVATYGYSLLVFLAAARPAPLLAVVCFYSHSSCTYASLHTSSY